MKFNKQNHYTQTFLTPFVRMEVFVRTANAGYIQFIHHKTLDFIMFKQEELKDFLMQIREMMEPNIPHPFKFRNLFKRDFYMRPSFPQKVSVTNRSSTFTFDSESLSELFKLEKLIYAHIKACQRMFPIISEETRNEVEKLI